MNNVVPQIIGSTQGNNAKHKIKKQLVKEIKKTKNEKKSTIIRISLSRD